MNAASLDRPLRDKCTRYLRVWLDAESEFYGKIGLRSSAKTIKTIKQELQIRQWEAMRSKAK